MPLYPALQKTAKTGEVVWRSKQLHGGAARVIAVTSAGIDLLLLDAPHLFDRSGGIYIDEAGKDWEDNALRFAALSQVGAEIAQGGIKAWVPDVVHAHDWQAGLVPAYLRQSGKAAPPCVLTIHNIAFQGNFAPELMKTLGLKPSLYTQDGVEF